MITATLFTIIKLGNNLYPPEQMSELRSGTYVIIQWSKEINSYHHGNIDELDRIILVKVNQK